MKQFRTILYGIAVAVCFALAIYSLYLNRSASAAIAAAFMLALILMQQLPILESFEILSLKAKFRAQVDEATQMLDHLRDSARLSARSTSLQLAYMNRIGSLGWGRKRVVLDIMDGNLRRLEVPDAEIAELKRPFLNMLTFDLCRIFERAAIERMRLYRNEADKIYQERYGRQAIRADDQAYRDFVAWQRSIAAPETRLSDPLGRMDFDRPRSFLEPWLASLPVSIGDRHRLTGAMDEVIALVETCWRDGTVTAEAEAYLKEFDPEESQTSRLDALGLPPVQLAPPPAGAAG